MDKHSLLIDTSIRLFHEKGFHGTPTSLIAKEAGVANGTLFQYFPSKENLIVEAYISIKEEMANELKINKESNANIIDQMKDVFTSSLTWALAHPLKFDFLQQFYNSPYHHKLKEQTIKKYDQTHLDLIQEAIEQGAIRSLPANLVYALISSHTYGLYQYLRVASHDQRKKVIDTGFELLMKMLT
ncbi:MAG: TetR/AcrR family transcriptional regulator [Cyclobacteriaceae bacterium]|nr:TetR/AcrR family transcriptional regulator [Cyclobacteriaceae bacterium HetDA_MAG_MS6]